MTINNRSDKSPALPLGEPAQWNRPRREWAVRLGLLVLLAFLFLPNLGSFGLWDPWETHYGEVTRNMVESFDWISPWWGYRAKIGPQGQQGSYFYSKPILIFWGEALSVRLIGFSEWAIRLPMALFAILTCFFSYYAVSKLWGRGAGLLASLILATSPQFFYLARQAQTDMMFVAPLSMAMLALALGLFGPWEGAISVRRTWAKVLIGIAFFFLITLPQLGLLITDLDLSRNVSNLPFFEALWVSASNNGLVHAAFYGLLTLLYLAIALLPLIRKTLRNELTPQDKDLAVRRTWFLVFAIMAGLATLGKGLLGFMLPGFILVVYLLVVNGWRSLPAIGVVRSLIAFSVVTLPWYVAMFVKHGNAFYTRFFVHDHFNRLGTGVHQIDSGTFEHFLKWLGIGFFPWVAFVPLVLIGAARIRLKTLRREDRMTLFVFLWFFLSYLLFTIAKTKFHHYIFPALPPMAVLAGKTIFEFIRDDANDTLKRWIWLGSTLVFAALSVVAFNLNDGMPYAIASLAMVIGSAGFLLGTLWTHKHPPQPAFTSLTWGTDGNAIPLALEISQSSAAVESESVDSAPEPATQSVQEGPVRNESGPPVAWKAIWFKASILAAVGIFVAVSLNLQDDEQLFRNLFTYKYDRQLPTHLPQDEDAVTTDEPPAACEADASCPMGHACLPKWHCKGNQTSCEGDDDCGEGGTCLRQGACDNSWTSSRFFRFTTPSVRWALTESGLHYENFLWFILFWGAGAMLLLLVRRLRWVAMTMLLIMGAGQTAWGLSHYLPMLSPHWSQKYVFENYYEQCGDDLQHKEVEAYQPIIMSDLGKALGGEALYNYFHATSKRVCPFNITSWLIVWRGETYYSYNELMPLEKKNTQLGPYLETVNPVAMRLPSDCGEGRQIVCPRKFYLFLENRKSNSGSSTASSVNSESKKLQRDRNSAAYSAYRDWDKWEARQVDEENDFFTLFEVVPRFKESTDGCSCADAIFP